jgi:hypothetical protein
MPRGQVRFAACLAPPFAWEPRHSLACLAVREELQPEARYKPNRPKDLVG